MHALNIASMNEMQKERHPKEKSDGKNDMDITFSLLSIHLWLCIELDGEIRSI